MNKAPIISDVTTLKQITTRHSIDAIVAASSSSHAELYANAWSYAIVHLIKSEDPEVIVNHIAPYATSPLFRKHPQQLLSADSRHAFQQAKDDYIINDARPKYKASCRAQLV